MDKIYQPNISSLYKLLIYLINKLKIHLQQINCMENQNDARVEPFQVTKRFMSMVVPASLGLFVGCLMTTLNLVFIGHLNDPVKLAAVGMGNMIINMCGIGPYYGLNSGMETLVSQAWGAGR